MGIDIYGRLVELHNHINARLDAIHAEALKQFRTLARSTGQYTRVRPCK